MTVACWMVLAGTPIKNVTAMTVSHVLMQATWKKLRWSIGIPTDKTERRWLMREFWVTVGAMVLGYVLYMIIKK